MGKARKQLVHDVCNHTARKPHGMGFDKLKQIAVYELEYKIKARAQAAKVTTKCTANRVGPLPAVTLLLH